MSGVTTITFFRYEGLQNKWWAFRQMGLAHKELESVPGLYFFKMLGCGRGKGFSVFPDFGTYGLLCCWSSEKDAKSFFNKNILYKNFKSKSTEQWTTYLLPTVAHGQWAGTNPFREQLTTKQPGPIAVITRATIYTKHLLKFWSFVPKVSRSVEDKPGRIFSIGIGELPIIQQATFSLWASEKQMMDYAYKSKYHQEVVKKTRELGWYQEELFARFTPVKSEGTFNGQDFLQPFFTSRHPF